MSVLLHQSGTGRSVQNRLHIKRPGTPLALCGVMPDGGVVQDVTVEQVVAGGVLPGWGDICCKRCSTLAKKLEAR